MCFANNNIFNAGFDIEKDDLFGIHSVTYEKALKKSRKSHCSLVFNKAYKNALKSSFLLNQTFAILFARR